MLCPVVSGLLLCGPAVPTDAADIPIRVERLSPRAVFLRAGTVGGYDEVAAVVTRRGLLIIDTSLGPTLMRRYLPVIERELGRGDVAYVVNTHSHGDHTDGNQLFADRPIVAHERCGPAMSLDAEDASLRDLALFRRRLAGFEEAQRGGTAPMDQRAALPDIVASHRVFLGDLERGDFQLTRPNLTFNDRLTLELGDLTARLYAYGAGMHTDNDILLLIPEEGLLFVGDVFAPGILRLTTNREADTDRAIAVLDEVLKHPADVRTTVTAHWGTLSRADLVLRRDYLVALRDGVAAGVSQGLTFAQLRQRLSLDGPFAFVRAGGFDATRIERWHTTNLRLLWARATGSRSAASLFEEALRSGGIAALRTTATGLGNPTEAAAYFDESELNALGYDRLNRGSPAEAVAVLQAAIAALPSSGNLHDSLGEACLAAGDKDGAMAAYEAALRLDPANANAATILARLRRE